MSTHVSAAALRNYFAAHLTHHLDALQQMVMVNSLTTHIDGVNALGRLTADYFAPWGFSAERIPSSHPEYGAHLLLTRPGRAQPDGSPAPIIGFVSHLDTVFSAAEEQANDFHWRAEGERLYGPGTVDIKGGTVLMGMMLEALQALYPALYERVTWLLLLDSAEEVGGADFGDLCRSRLGGAAACLIFEGGARVGNEYRLVVARKGMAHFNVRAGGRSAHAGVNHPVGANAIVQLAEVVQRIAAMTDYDRELTFNVGTVQGGTVVNRVPHTAALFAEMRTYDMAVYEAGIAGVAALAGAGSVASGDGSFHCAIEVDVAHKTLPWPRNNQTDALLGYWEAAGAELGIAVAPEARGGLSDGNHFWDVVPTLDGLGPSGANAHCSERSADGSKDQEYVLRDSFVPKAVLNTTALLKLVATLLPERAV